MSSKQKMERFLASLKYRTVNEINARNRIKKEKINLEEDFNNIKSSTSTILFRRHSLPQRPIHIHVINNKKVNTTENVKPKYVPASPYPLPMLPASIKATPPSQVATRTYKLSQLRPTPNQIEFSNQIDITPIPDISITKLT